MVHLSIHSAKKGVLRGIYFTPLSLLPSLRLNGFEGSKGSARGKRGCGSRTLPYDLSSRQNPSIMIPITMIRRERMNIVVLELDVALDKWMNGKLAGGRAEREFAQLIVDMAEAPVDPRTGNLTLYNRTFQAVRTTIVGDVNQDWVRRELDWFNSGSRDLNDMEPPVPGAFQDCADEDGIVNSAYGWILFNPAAPHSADSKNAWEQVVQRFRKEGTGTRRATVIISDRGIHTDAWANGRNDFICTNALNFYMDSEYKLWINAQMRSMDAVWGYRADTSMWTDVLEKTVNELREDFPGVSRGGIVYQVANLHVYPRHHEMWLKAYHTVITNWEKEDRLQWK